MRVAYELGRPSLLELTPPVLRTVKKEFHRNGMAMRESEESIVVSKPGTT